MTLSCRILFLDFDGIVLESVGVKTEAFRDLFAEHPDRLPEILAYHLANNGVSRYVKFEHIYRNILGLPYDDALRAEVGERFSRLAFGRVLSCPFVPGMPAFLDEFASRVSTFVVSASPGEELRRIVEGRRLLEYFRGVCGTPGTKLEHMRSILERKGVEPKEAWMIGDSVEDWRAATAAGVRFIGRCNQETFEGTGAETFPDMSAIAAALRKRIALAR